ncbi:RnfABCDGE type electron transport complex subunit G [Clostridium sp.]|uniref:RnfABCDGE type electron transport complex subunit G n=1 Tax=Clostridium sp. TaxID=1506 RepID=UPI002606845C|nr:RnfABCDGE type electron transport complex subunit G [Clostridium sp.]
MRENLKLGLILFLITSFAGLLLGVANDFTKEVIAQNSKLSSDDLKEILPNANKIEDYAFEKSEDSKVSEVYEAKKDSNTEGFVLKVSPKGFNGAIDMVVGISNEGEISGIKILSQAETPGLGARVEEKEFTDKFKGIGIKEEVKIVKSSPKNNTEIQGLTGATISSNAVLSGIKDALNFLKGNILGEEVVEVKELNLKKLNLHGEMKELTINLEEGINKVYLVSKDGREVGYAIEGSQVGMYKDNPITFGVGLSLEGIITGVQIINHKETAGLGDLIEQEEFLNEFIGISALDKTNIKENTEEIDMSVYGEVLNVDAITGATKSSMAIIKGVTNVLNFYNNNLGN